MLEPNQPVGHCDCTGFVEAKGPGQPYSSTDPHRACKHELDRLREYLERVVAAAHNPDCLNCAEVRRLGHEALRPPPPALGDWQT
jgi:hypothetical protein